MRLLIVVVATLVMGAWGHGAVVHPPPRQAVDRSLPPWNNKTVQLPVPGVDGWCLVANATNGATQLSGSNGQACFWFSNGCGIGCDKCDGNTRGPIPNVVPDRMDELGKGKACKEAPDLDMGYVLDSNHCNQICVDARECELAQFKADVASPTSNCWLYYAGSPCTLRPDAGYTVYQRDTTMKKMPVCPEKEFKATICDPQKRTVNTGAKCGAKDDWYYYSPWRAPGSSAVFDACGMAGGTPSAGGYGARYRTTKFAKQGDLGTEVLEPLPSGTTWKAGDLVEVSWAIQANHGGGYAYRLCPASMKLTEECFKQMPLAFEGKQMFRWGDGTEFSFDGTYVTEGTTPKGSMWAMNPIPRNDTKQTLQSFEPRCKEVPDCGSTLEYSRCRCSGMWGPYNLQIVDKVRIPKGTPPGRYVLGWRWDCEESNQIWSSCSDVTIE